MKVLVLCRARKAAGYGEQRRDRDISQGIAKKVKKKKKVKDPNIQYEKGVNALDAGQAAPLGNVQVTLNQGRGCYRDSWRRGQQEPD